MPSAIFKKKRRKIFGRKTRNQRRASAQASPASRFNVSELMSDTALPRPVCIDTVIPAPMKTLQVQENAEEVEGRFAHVNDSRLTPVIMVKDVERLLEMLELPSFNDLLADFDFSKIFSTIRPHLSAGEAETPKPASLMGLPVELRIMIFKSVFPPSDPGGTTETTLYCAPTLRVLGPSHSQLCRVNRQISEETRGLLYGQTLVFLSQDALTQFSSTRTCQQMSQIRSICMKPRVTNWSSAIRTLVLPPSASLTVHWPITRELWQALTANITLDYRQVNVLSGHEEKRVVFKPVVTTVLPRRPTYESLQRTFASVSG